MQKSKLFVVTASHFCVDTYATLLAPLLPLMMAKMGMSLTSAGFLATFYSITSITQPFMGIWGDGMKRRRLVIGGLLLACVMPLMGVAVATAIAKELLLRRDNGRLTRESGR